jgi:hypothetical protein
MAFTRVRTINGRQYLYSEERWREGGKVRSRSISLGPVSGPIATPVSGARKRKSNLATNLAPPPHGHSVEERLMVQNQEHKARDAEARGKALGELHDKFGMSVGPASPVPVDKPSVDVVAAPAAIEAAPAEQETAPPGGEAEGQ